MHENGVVAVVPGRINKDLRHIAHLQPALLAAHLVPLRKIAVTGMNLAQELHGQIVHQFKRGNPVDRRPILQRIEKTFSPRHNSS